MKPVDQTKFGNGEGNCMAACIASLLEISLDEVPILSGDFQYRKLAAWLAQRGLGYNHLPFKAPMATGDSFAYPWGTGFYIAGGKSPRGEYDHAVIMQNGKMVHDPHPSREGIHSITGIDFIVSSVNHDLANWFGKALQNCEHKNKRARDEDEGGNYWCLDCGEVLP